MNERPLPDVIEQLLRSRLVVAEAAEHYAFRHALSRDAVYGTLVRRERKALHEEVGKVLEQLYAGRLDPYLGALAYHFYEADEWEKALIYAAEAGQKAQEVFALREAIDHYTRALEATQHLPGQPRAAQLYRARGQARDTLGEFDLARADHEASLQVARAQADLQAEWQALIDLGLLWTSRDYAQTGLYLEQALQLARTISDRTILGQTLNRLGNWHLNIQQMLEARLHHQEALFVFRELNDRQGMAETLDLLGMATCLSGDLMGGEEYYQQAIHLFEDLGDQRGLVSTLAGAALTGVTYHTNAIVPIRKSLAEAMRQPERSLAAARAMGWRSAEAFALFILSTLLGPRGRYDLALPFAQEGMRLAQEIEHRQWITALHFAQGHLRMDLLDLPGARQQFEQGLGLARAIGSLFWQRLDIAYLALIGSALGELEQAQALLDSVPVDDASAQSLVERTLGYVRLELALARDDPAGALRLAEGLLTSTAGVAHRGPRAVPRVLLRRGEALWRLGREPEAEADLRAALEGALELETPSLVWRVQAQLARLYQEQGRVAEAREAAEAARALIEELAARVPDPPLRESFRTRALAMLPPAQAT